MEGGTRLRSRAGSELGAAVCGVGGVTMSDRRAAVKAGAETQRGGGWGAAAVTRRSELQAHHGRP